MKPVRSALVVVLTAGLLPQTLVAQGDAAKAQELVQRAIKAMGGEKALQKSRFSIIEDSGTYYGMGQGVSYSGRYVAAMQNPPRMRIDIIDVFTSVTDGKTGWIAVNGMALDLEGEQLKVTRSDALVGYVISLFPLQKPDKKFRLSLAEAEQVEGEACDGVKVDHDDISTVTILFSRKTGLIRKTVHKTKAPEQGFKEVTDVSIYDSFKEFEGVKTPTKVTIYRDGKKFVESNVQKVTYPKSIDESEFKKPE